MHAGPTSCCLRVLFLTLLIGGLGGCGDEAPVAPWGTCELVGVDGLSGACADGDDLLFCAGNGDKRIYTVPRADLVRGAKLTPRVLEVTVSADVRIVGRELLARRGYTLGTLWNASVDLQGIAVQKPGLVFLADAAFRVVYWGRLVRGMDGRPASITIQHVFEVPGARRTGQDVADYKDHGFGISGLYGVDGEQRTEDLYLVERAWSRSDEEAPTRFRVLVLDRFGSLGGGGGDLGYFVLEVGGVPDVEALAWEPKSERFLCVRGTGRGALHVFRSPGSMRTGKLGQAIPAPALEGAGTWRGLTIDEDGRWILVRDSDPAIVAWRTP